MFIPRIGNRLVSIQLSEYVALLILMRKWKSLNFCHCETYQAKISHGIRSFFLCEKFPSLLYLLAFLPGYFKIVTASLFIALEHVQGFAEMSA